MAIGKRPSVPEWQGPFIPKGSIGGADDISSAVTLDPSNEGAPLHVSKLMLGAATQSLRYTLDGTTPTATVGFLVKAGEPPHIIALGEDVTVKIIEVSATCVESYQWGQ